MAYLALYRVWRPQRFADVVGQEQTVAALRNAVRLRQLSHAYIFAGPRGTGKTSAAKILARAVNCSDPQEGEPCNACVACRDGLNGNFMDVIEIDAASNRGIDEIRDLREQVNILPAQGKRKVYIIDEVHMLTAEAFNALLKTLEEPPDTVLFILATTELHKIPATIISRCQKYTFLRLTPAQIETRLRQVADKEGFLIEDGAVKMIARRANGGMRDALGMLDQVLTYEKGRVSAAHVAAVLGLVDEMTVADLIDQAVAGDNGALIRLIADGIRAGIDVRQLVRESSLYLRDLLGYSLKLQPFETNFTGAAVLAKLEAQAGSVTPDQVRAALEMMMGTGERLRYAEEGQFLLEMAFLEMSRLFTQKQPPEPAPGQREKNPPPVKGHPAPEPPAGQSAFWKELLSKVKTVKNAATAYALLNQGQFIGVADNVVYVGYKRGHRFHKEKMEEKAIQVILQQSLQELSRPDMRLEVMFLDDPRCNELLVKKAAELFGSDKVQVIEEEE
jgi:DNA polymerase-3 subunit gamma/tau